MKKVALGLGLFILLLFGFMNSNAQVIVKVRPVEPALLEAKPNAPYKEAVWVEPGWRWKHKAYVREHGHWVKPRKGLHWVPGRWEDRPGGVIWIRGDWAK